MTPWELMLLNQHMSTVCMETKRNQEKPKMRKQSEDKILKETEDRIIRNI